MDTKILGRTGLRVSVAGLGCGGHSRLGQAYGNSAEQSVAVVRAAIDMGINFIDTAAAYGTEKIVGEAVRGRRDKVVISTKTAIQSWGDAKAAPFTGAQILEQLEKNLSRLGTDYIDLYNLHGIVERQLGYVAAEIVPALIRAREQGKIRFLGITEHFGSDTDHKMLSAAIPTGVWDVVMVGFNLLNPSARRNVLRLTQTHSVGVQDMFAVRRALSNPEGLKEALDQIEKAGQLDRSKLDAGDPLGFLKEGTEGIVDAAYRFCRHEPGIDVVLTGTGKVEHLRENVASINRGPLPAKTLARLEELFGQVDSVSGN
ncbi:MAG TPA: aldo/keto reductase [Rhizomicrobium sp.]|nr:aldo/keto reductase [Rhizomicrobium sp.]